MRKREHVIPLRLNKKEMAYLEKQVAMSRMPREEYLRALVMGGEVRARPCTHHDGQYSRNAYTPQSYCAAYVAAKKYGLDVSGFSFERVCQLCSGLEPQAQRRFLSDAKQAAYAVERIVRRGLREMELSVTPEADYSVEQKAAVKESGQPKPGKVKKAAQPERE
ncbi:hypothetical protein JXX19_07465 [Ruthenibacterium lactatiformans]|nr:hypothetical protein [Ruthenibacterium lactatiformans]MBN3026263.1 hypothetical protein [Ruthenibacterium lactatiformans]